MSAERKIVLESCRPHNCYNLTWKIHRISGFQATEEAPLKSTQFSTNEQVWQLAMYKLHATKYYSSHFYVNICLCSANVWYTNVHFEFSTVINGKKYLENEFSSRLCEGQVVDLWNDDGKCVLDLLKDDALTLDIKIETWQDTTEMMKCLEVTPHYNLNIRMTKMLTDQTLMDVTLQVKDKEFKAHKIVLAAASPVFEAMFKEGTKEREDNFVKVEDIDSDVFEVFLRYLYSGQVDQLDEMVSGLLAVADKYDVQPLREICMRHMAKNISVDNAVDVLALAHRHSIDSIKSVASNYLKDNFSAVTQTDSWTSLFDNFVAKK